MSLLKIFKWSPLEAMFFTVIFSSKTIPSDENVHVKQKKEKKKTPAAPDETVGVGPETLRLHLILKQNP